MKNVKTTAGRRRVDLELVRIYALLVVLAGLLVYALWVPNLTQKWSPEARLSRRIQTVVASGDAARIKGASSAGAAEKVLAGRTLLTPPLRGWYQQNGDELLLLMGDRNYSTAVLLRVRRQGDSWLITDAEVGGDSVKPWWMMAPYEPRWVTTDAWGR